MDPSKREYPPWVAAGTPPKLWLDVSAGLPWLLGRPYLVERERVNELRTALDEMGFLVVEASVADGIQDVEEAFRLGLTQALAFDTGGAASWSALNDRLWRSLSSEATAVAVLVHGFEDRAWRDIYGFVRCVYNALSLTDGIGISDATATRQIEYFFLGGWEGGRSTA